VSIPDRIRAARARAGLSQRALAALLGVDKSAVAQWEGGGGGVGIRTANLVELARVLGVRPSELLGDASPADQPPDQLVLDDPDEIAFIALYRKLPKRLQDIHRQMLLHQTNPGQASELESHPPDHTRVVA
jgi:transcriptional regulator with XRE-family HTH domain